MPTALMVNPRRRRRKSRRKSRRPNPFARKRTRARRRRRANPFTRRRRAGRRRRRNPAVISKLLNFKALLGPGIVGVVAGVATGFVDAKFLGKFGVVGRTLVKLGLALAGGAVLGKNPARANAFIAGVTATMGYDWGLKAGGGIVAPTKEKAASDIKEGMANLAMEDGGAFAALVEEVSQMGALVEDMGSYSLDTDPSLSELALDTDVSLSGPFDELDIADDYE